MSRLIWRTQLYLGLAVIGLVQLIAAPALAARSASALPALTTAGPGECDVYNPSGGYYTVACSATGSGGSSSITCAVIPVPALYVQLFNLQPDPPPTGMEWAFVGCSNSMQTNIELINKANPMTPWMLAIQAAQSMQIPFLSGESAPPRGRAGLVGLPEWFWVPSAQWHSLTATASAGSVWARVVAKPILLSFSPGDGSPPVYCAGPGTPYRSGISASAQHTQCSYRYLRPSAGMPGGSYPVAVTVYWQVTWTGSGGVGGQLASSLPLPDSFDLRIGQGEALVSG